MGSVVKLLLRFRQPFWAEVGVPELAFLQTPGGPFQAVWTTRPVESSVLTCWSGGPSADRLTRLDPNTVLNLALDQLSQSFPIDRDQLRQSVAEWRVFEWQSDSFTR